MILLKIILWLFLILLAFIVTVLFLALVPHLKGRLIFNNKEIHFKGRFLFGLVKVYYSENVLIVKILNFKIYQPKDKDDGDHQESITEDKEVKEELEKSKEKNLKRKKALRDHHCI